MTEPEPTVPKPKLRWFQLSLRTLLVVVTLCAIPCSWLAVKRQQVKREREAAAVFETFGGDVGWSKPTEPKWLCDLMGDDFFRHVESLNFGSTMINNGQLRELVVFGTKVTDEGLRNLKELSQLTELYVYGPKVTDKGLENLKGLSQLTVLWLCATNVTDKGSEHLKDLSQLTVLCLSCTKVTDNGLENLKGLSQLEKLHLDGTNVTDKGLENLKELSQLRTLTLEHAKVTDTGVKELQQALPNCKITK